MTRSWQRRQFLGSAAAAAGGLTALAADAEPPRPRPTTPRATSGDAAEPKWEERLTLSVGPRKADLAGTDDRVIQAAVDYVGRLGGGTVHILPGTYRFRNAVHLHSQVRLLGSGADSVLVKEPSHASKLDADSDWFDQEITLADARGFQVGDGVCLRAKNPHNGSTTVAKRRTKWQGPITPHPRIRRSCVSPPHPPAIRPSLQQAAAPESPAGAATRTASLLLLDAGCP